MSAHPEQSGATPGPWVLSSDTHKLGGRAGTYRQILDGDGMGANIIGFVGVAHPANFDINEQGEANARLIVRAVNCHDEMLAVLQAIVRAADGRQVPGHLIVDENSPLMGAAREAIARATGERS